MKIAFVGSGRVGGALADNLQKSGHDVVLAKSKDGSESVAKMLEKNPKLRADAAEAAVKGADVVFVAVPFMAASSVLEALAPHLEGKVIVDCTNPVGPGLSHGLESKTSGSEALQKVVPGAKVVKAFTIYGYENLEDPAYPKYDVKPAMLFCGDDAAAKKVVDGLITQLGFEPVDVGGLQQALHLEHMTLLWVRLVRAKGQSPNLVWAALRR